MNLITRLTAPITIGTALNMYNTLGEEEKLPNYFPYMYPIETATDLITTTTFVAIICTKKPFIPFTIAFGILSLYGLNNTIKDLQGLAKPTSQGKTPVLRWKSSVSNTSSNQELIMVIFKKFKQDWMASFSKQAIATISLPLILYNEHKATK